MMNNPSRVSVAGSFIRRMKKIKKKHRHVESDVDRLIEILMRGETPGDQVPGVGEHVVYKTRLASQDLQRGKSGGFRVIYYLRTENHTFLLTIYIKTEREDISVEEILQLIAEVDHELLEDDESKPE
jgi:mRNA-degrading endonuclease RelE of RelBE toxin-antitoxin system